MATLESKKQASSRIYRNEPSGMKETQVTFLQAPLLELLICEVLEDQLASGIEGVLPMEKF